jgi:uncharacterized membrane protein YdjX (TVP38/TMEM64 family)
MARQTPSRRLARLQALSNRYFVYAYHPIVTKLSVSFAALGLLILLVEGPQGRTALRGMQTALSQHALAAAALLAVLFFISTLSPFFPEFLVTVSAGFLLGLWTGGVFAILAITLAASGNFFIARRQGRRVIQLTFDLHSVREIHWTATRVTPWMVFLTWLLPSINFDLISYASGLSPMRFRTFLPLTVLGSLLSTGLLAFLGQALRSDQANVVAVTLVVYTCVGTLLYVKELPPWFEERPVTEGRER